MNKPRILVVGTSGIELMANVSGIPALSHTQIETEGYEYLPGGLGAISAHAINLLGAESVLCSKLGNDTHGAKLSTIFEMNGINTRFITTDKNKRTPLDIIINEEDRGTRTISYKGAGAAIKDTEIEDALTCYPDAVLLHFDIPKSAVMYTARTISEYDNPPITVVDATMYIEDFDFEKLGKLDIFVCNEEQAFEYTGIKTNTLDNCLKICLALSGEIQAKYFILKLGSRGVYLYDGTYYKLISEYNVEVEDNSGASDVFTAALCVEYLRSYNINRACEFASIASAYTRTKKGYFYSVPSEEELREFIISHNINFHLDNTVSYAD